MLLVIKLPKGSVISATTGHISRLRGWSGPIALANSITCIFTRARRVVAKRNSYETGCSKVVFRRSMLPDGRHLSTAIPQGSTSTEPGPVSCGIQLKKPALLTIIILLYRRRSHLKVFSAIVRWKWKDRGKYFNMATFENGSGTYSWVCDYRPACGKGG